jgi:predicted Zn-dependent protease with MMP-like domain
MRGPLLPHNVPFHSTRDGFFARNVKDAVAELDARLGSRVQGISIAYEEIPNLADLTLNTDVVPLGRIVRGHPTTIVLYQRPIEMRSENTDLLARIIRDVLAEYVAVYLGIEPSDVDPDYLGPDLRN